MKTPVFAIQLAAGLAAGWFAAAALAQDTNTGPRIIDLPAALRLADAQNYDVQIAREKVTEAQAVYRSSLFQFFPWISPGVGFRGHDGKLQDVGGSIIDVHKYAYAPGAALVVQLDLGDTIYKSLVAKRLTGAAGHALDAQRQDTVLAAALGYFDLAFARGAVRIAEEAVRISSDYERQVQSAADVGMAFKGDVLRVRVQTERYQLALRQAAEQQRLVSALLAQTLRLDPTVELVARETDLVPLVLVETNAALGSLVERTLAARPELKQARSLAEAAREARKGTTVGPLIPSVGAQGFAGGLGGGRTGVGDTFGGQEDYLVGLSWRIGPGGIFDVERTRTAESRLRLAELNTDKTRLEVTRQIVAAFTHWQSAGDQMETARRGLAAAEEGFRLAQQRKEYAVGIVLETIQAEQDLTRARLDFARSVAEFDKSQYSLNKAAGNL